MTDSYLESLPVLPSRISVPLFSLMPKRVRTLLLVSSPYDAFTFEQDGRLTEILLSEYLELNLRYAPRIARASTADEALAKLGQYPFDLVISMPRVGDMDVIEFSKRVKKVRPDLPVVLLAYHTRELKHLQAMDDQHVVDRIFTWHGDTRLFLAIIKYIEDQFNLEHDVRVADVQCIILIEDDVSFYSSYLPIFYTELVIQTQELMREGLNRMEKFIRMRARPKILLATCWEEALNWYKKYQDNVLGVITDVSFPCSGKMDKEAGLKFAKMVREETWDRAVLVQSSDDVHRKAAFDLGAQFINKNSPTLLRDVQDFIREHLGFGDFIFRMLDGEIVGRAGNLQSLAELLHEVPDESLLYHVTRNHFSLWLMARTEFDLARALRPRQVQEFEDTRSIREYLIGLFDEHLIEKSAGVIADYSSGAFLPGSNFIRIGSGSLGGKGRGLGFINSQLEKYIAELNPPDVRIFVPRTTVLTTEVFDLFMEENELTDKILLETDDRITREAFLNAKIPNDAKDMLRDFLERVNYPLAVRSSSLQEDASYQPFAGMYQTYMLPNNDDDLEIRLVELCNAVKMVYASTYYADPRSYFEATPNRLEEEKMAVVIQEVVGQRHGDYQYPDISGTARSYDFYPVSGRKSEDGVVHVSLGLGKTVVDGGKCIRFSPEYPRKLNQFSGVEDYLEHAPREFYALDMTQAGPNWDDSDAGDTNVVQLGLDAAEEHGTIHALASTYVAENDTVYDGTSRKGVRLITMAGVLKHDVFPLADTIKFLLEMGRKAFSCPVEIEFAVNLKKPDKGQSEIGFLQIRPLVIGQESFELHLEDIDVDQAICVSNSALGQGYVTGIFDLVYVREDNFDRQKTVEIAGEIENINSKLKSEGRNYVLIGPGRWGTADRFFGIPVNWAQISRVQAIIETDIKGVPVQPSQGAHFFHNITSLGIPYFTVNRDVKTRDGTLDMEWLESQPASFETEHVRLLTFDKEIGIATDGRSRTGVVLKPGVEFIGREE